MKYTYSDEEDNFLSDSTGNRRSTRNTGANTPAEAGPVTTSSGRQVRAPPRLNMVAAEGAPGSTQGDGSEYDQENPVGPSGRPRRSAAVNHAINGVNGSRRHGNGSADTDDEDGSEAGFGDDEHDADAHISHESDDEEEFEEDEVDSDEQPRSLVVKLSVTSPRLRTVLAQPAQANKTFAAEEDQRRKVKTSTADTVMLGTPEAPAQEYTTSVVDRAPRGATGERSMESAPPVNVDVQREPSPSAAAPTSLAFRGSPEKALRQPSLSMGDDANKQ